MKETKNKSQIKKIAFIKSIPILCSYIFLGIAYGIMMNEAGFKWYLSGIISATVYTGAFQFVLITFLAGGAGVATLALTAFLVNSRQTFYALTYLKDFQKMGKRKFYMIYTLTDETYAVNCTLSDVPEKERHDVMFYIAHFSHLYWIIGSILGGALGQLIPFELKGIDFCMTALFVIIFIDQWEKADKHSPALIGLFVSILCLLIFGQSRFMLPALLITSALLLVVKTEEAQHE